MTTNGQPLAVFNITHGDIEQPDDVIAYQVHEVELTDAVSHADNGTWYMSVPMFRDGRETGGPTYRMALAAVTYAAQSAGWPVKATDWADVGHPAYWPAGVEHGQSVR